MGKKQQDRDALGNRMKTYENVTRMVLPRRTYTVMRVDGRAFHTWTKGLTRPYDIDLMVCMDLAALALCEEVAGARFAFVQSDEISVLATDFEETTTQAWFDGSIQKWVSVGASIATMAFNEAVRRRMHTRRRVEWALLPGGDVLEEGIKLGTKTPNATFDARVYTIPDYIEVENYFVWRQQDAERNSVTMLAQHYASHKELHGKKRAEQHEIIHKAGDNWVKHPASFKHGRVIRRASVQERWEVAVEPWMVDSVTPMFTAKRDYLRNMIPRHWEGDQASAKKVGQ